LLLVQLNLAQTVKELRTKNTELAALATQRELEVNDTRVHGEAVKRREQDMDSTVAGFNKRIAELELQDKRLAGLQWRLDSMVEQARVLAQQAPAPGLDDAAAAEAPLTQLRSG